MGSASGSRSWGGLGSALRRRRGGCAATRRRCSAGSSGRRAGPVAATTAVAGCRPAAMVRTLIWGQGTEMARWADIEKALGIKVYFCDPRSPWQRPTNEHTNGLQRRWLPKSTDLNIPAVRLAIIEDNLNTMPRKPHCGQSAQTIYTALSYNHQ
ncbi:MAG: IS30 family transposase [bacterium]|nr:IS30 family transposase [bacterium]